jgi:hypothetical protein
MPRRNANTVLHRRRQRRHVSSINNSDKSGGGLGDGDVLKPLLDELRRNADGVDSIPISTGTRARDE